MGENPRLRSIRRIPLFAGLSDASLQNLLAIATEFEVPAGHVLVETGHEASGLFFIEEGTVVVEAAGKRIERGAGEVVGELALLAPETARTARARASTPVRGLAISRHDFRKTLESEPALALALLGVLASRLAQSTAG